MIDAATGAHLWADRYDGDLEDVFDLQDKITAKVVGAIEPTMRKAEIERARRKPVENLVAYDFYLRALPYVYAVRPDENLRALGFLNKAIDLDPVYAPALAHAAWCLVQRTTRDWPPSSADDVGTAVALARRAIAAGMDDAVAMVLGGFVLVAVGRDYGPGLEAVRHAIEQNPGSGFVCGIAGSAMVFGDDLENGLVLLERAMAFGPLDPSFSMNLVVAGLAHLLRGRPDRAVELSERSVTLSPNWDSPYWLLTAAYTHLDRLPEAQSALAKFMSLAPGATTASLRTHLPIRNPESLEMILDGLRKAGLPN